MAALGFGAVLGVGTYFGIAEARRGVVNFDFVVVATEATSVVLGVQDDERELNTSEGTTVWLIASFGGYRYSNAPGYSIAGSFSSSSLLVGVETTGISSRFSVSRSESKNNKTGELVRKCFS